MIDSLTHWLNTFPIFMNWIWNFVAAILIFIVGMAIGRWARRRVRNSKIGGTHLDATLKPVLASALFYGIAAMTLYAVLIKVGVPPTSLIAVFGAAGLAIALALKDTLSNIAAGIMLLFLRPLAVGEFVDLVPVSGTVVEVGLFSTTLKTSEGVFQYVPNSEVWNTRIQNYGRHKTRRFTQDIGVSYDNDLRETQRVLLETLGAAPDRIQDIAPEAIVTNLGETSVVYSCRVWLPAEDWGTRTSELRIEIFEALAKANIEIPYPRRVVTMKPES